MENITAGKKLVLGFQHVLAMFGATVLVPFLTGLDPAIALFSAGVGTLLFHLCSKMIVPVFLGSSFAFIGAIALTLNPQGFDNSVLRGPGNWVNYLDTLAVVKGGIIAAGFVYILIAGLIYFLGVETIKKFFPPIITGPIIVVIGLRLSPIAINSAFLNNGVFDLSYVAVSSIVLLTMIVVSIFAHGFFKMVPILIAVGVGYLVSVPFGLLDTTSIQEASMFTAFDPQVLSQLGTLPTFTLSGVIAIAPIALVVFIEHIGDITTNGAVVGKNFLENPGVHRTMLGDGVATVFAGLIGAPANTTYSENTGVLAVTKVYDPKIIRIAAVIAILLSFVGKFAAAIRSIPTPVMGGISIMLFGMIASVGMRILINAALDFSHSRNLIISAIILVLGIGVSELPLGATGVTISGLALAALFGVVLNIVLPQEI
ncbi:uracil-xanthine permease family protein [Anaerotalea alkaliphila]|uniref:Uracil-xanthine permease n=1 Tax=Anaerotalea alkaliphila TaxID=2662126 RepID=A0A7X5HWS8_9FIRM|nr:uracil-xanthine permease family protein [Anaerotalea alkaliphila]NDL67931.1 uracil-xanthine permease [Anaerotalea alkaliphila]